MTDYILSIGTIAGGIVWMFNPGGTILVENKSKIVSLMQLIMGVCSIIGGLKLWPH